MEKGRTDTDRSAGRERPPWRRLDMADASLISAAAMLGGGIFIVPGMAADRAGPAMLLSLPVSALAALSGGWAAHAISTARPPDWAVVSRDATRWLARVCAAAALSGTFAAYALGPSGGRPARLLAVAIPIGLTALAVAGVRISWRANGALAAIRFSALAALMGLAFPLARSTNFQPLSPRGPGSVWAAAALLFFLFGGFDRLTDNPGEVIDPRHTVPRATAAGVAVTLCVSLAVCAAAIGVAGPLFTARSLSGAPILAPLLVPASFTNLPAFARGVTAVGAVFATAAAAFSLLTRAGRLAVRTAGGGMVWAATMGGGAVAAALAGSVGAQDLLTASAFLTLLSAAVMTLMAALHTHGAARGLHAAGLALCVALAAAIPRPNASWALAGVLFTASAAWRARAVARK